MLLIYTPGPEIKCQGYSIDRRFVNEEVKTALQALAAIGFVAIFVFAGFGPMVYIVVNICIPLGSILRFALLKGAWVMLFITLMLLLGNLLFNFENPTLVIMLGV